MKLAPAKIGVENKKKVIWLGGLMAVFVGVLIWNSMSSDSSPSGPTKAAPRATVAPGGIGPRTATPSIMPAHRTGRGGQADRTEDFRPTLKLPENTDVSKIDPTLKLELLAKLRKIEMEGGARSVFDFGQPPPPPPPKVDPLHPGPMGATTAANKGPDKPAEPPKPAGPPPPPPIPLKFYGYASAAKSGPRRAFFLNGDDIFVAAENDTIQNRYKVIRIGVNSAVVEDTTNKHEQTLPLVEELPG
jgi:hypothetical protein